MLSMQKLIDTILCTVLEIQKCVKNCPSRGLLDFQGSVGEFDKWGIQGG